MVHAAIYQRCSCGVVCEEARLEQHECKRDGERQQFERTHEKDETRDFQEASNDFLSAAAVEFGRKPFLIQCNCSGRCTFGEVPRETPSREIRKKFEAHFRAVNPNAAVRTAKVEAQQLKRKAEQLEKELQEIDIRSQQAKHNIEVAKATAERTHVLISEQSETLVKDNARLQRELIEIQGESLCLICRDSKKSEAFVPCGHCVCKACYDRLASQRADSVICPTCRREVCFTMRVYVWTKQSCHCVRWEKKKTYIERHKNSKPQVRHKMLDTS